MRIDLAALQHRLACLKPGSVIHVGAAVQKADEWEESESDRCGDEQHPDEEPPARAF